LAAGIVPGEIDLRALAQMQRTGDGVAFEFHPWRELAWKRQRRHLLEEGFLVGLAGIASTPNSANFAAPATRAVGLANPLCPRGRRSPEILRHARGIAPGREPDHQIGQE